MPAIHPCRDPFACEGFSTELPLRRTTLSLLLATGVFAGAHAAPASAASHPPSAAGARFDATMSGPIPAGEVVTISLSDDETSGLSEVELEARRQRREARTARALRIAATWRKPREATTHGPLAPPASEPPRRRPSGALPSIDAPAMPTEPVVGPSPRLSNASASNEGIMPAAQPVQTVMLPGASPQAAEPASPAGPDWATATRQAEARMRTRARTHTAATNESTSPPAEVSKGGASLASAETGRVTLAAMLGKERVARNFPGRSDRLHLADPGRVSPPRQSSPLSTLAEYWAADPAAAGGVVSLSPQADLRPIFLAAVEAAFDRSPQVQFAYASYQAQLADVDEVKGRRWPQLQFASRSKAVEFAGPASNAPGRGTPITANLTTSLFDWGYLSKTIESRKETADAGKEFYDAQRENSAYTVATTIVELAKQRQLIRISQQFVDRMQQLVTMLSQIVEIDRGRASELTQARARLLQAQASRDTVAAKARDTELTLRKLVGDLPLQLPSASAWNIEPAGLERLLSSMNRHPQILQARAEAQAARLLADAVRASARPAVNWVVSKTTGRDSADRRQPFQTMLTLNWNAFQGGSARAAQQAALARAQASERKVEQARLDLEYAIRAADEDARTLLERSTLYGDLVDETDRVRKAFFDQWYHLGKRTLLDVLQAENDHYGNRVSEITTRFDGYEAVFRELSSAGELMSWLKGMV